MAKKKRYYSADEAIDRLKVAKGTLYSYVSRGLVRSEEVGGKTRARRYLAADVDALVERKQQRRNPERVAQAALHWGSPVLESALTAIEGDRLYYRGHDAAQLALTQTFEAVANLLWLGEFETAWPSDQQDEINKLWQNAAALIQLDELRAFHGGNVKPLEAFQIALPAIGAADLTAYTVEPAIVHRTARRIIQIMSRLVTNGLGVAGSRPLSIAEALQRAWVPSRPEAKGLIDAMLILCADHELNVSSFTVRCVASAGSSPYAAVVAGLSALQGHRHGGASELVELLLDEAKGSAQTAVTNRLKRGEIIPGFGHPLYAEADPRCDALLALAKQYGQAAPNKGGADLEMAQQIIEMVGSHLGQAPNLDFGLAVLSRVLGLPQGAPLTIFALGRTAGWIGHYLEQIESGQLIRPRATYTGASVLQ